MPVITKKLDYFNPAFLPHLRKCNIEYGKCLKLYKKQQWEKARIAYEDYIKNMNKIDKDAKYELAVCYFQLSLKEEKPEKSPDFRISFKMLQNLGKANPQNQKIAQRLYILYTKRARDRKLDAGDWNNWDDKMKTKMMKKILDLKA